MGKILIVDDEDRIRKILRLMLEPKGHQVIEAADGETALRRLTDESFDLVITDIRMEGLSGEELLEEIKKRDYASPVVFITAYASLESAVEALRLGAADYIVKPFEERQIHMAVERALGFGRIMMENVRLRRALDQDRGVDEPVFLSKKMKEVAEMARRVAASEATVLITGESGTGKEVIARLIHGQSPRKKARFVAVNCAAISPNLVESELFGHERGAFTGAQQRKEGKFEFASGGTLFLDEVGDLPVEAQAKFLRALQERVIQRVGGNRDIRVEVRVICATNQDLKKRVEKGLFRQDLYYRIAVFPIQVPPLRERKEAIVPLAVHFLRKLVKVRETTKDFLTPGAMKLLENYAWPGNVRELVNAMERVAILKAGALPVTSDDLRFLLVESGIGQSGDGGFTLPPTGINYDALQRSLVKQALERAAGNQSQAARILGLTRARFRTLLKLLDEESS